MSMKKHGNKETKKPKKAKPMGVPTPPASGLVTSLAAPASDRVKKKK